MEIHNYQGSVTVVVSLVGHWARECLQPFNICSIELNVEQKEQLLYQLMVELDMSEESPELADQGEDSGNRNE